MIRRSVGGCRPLAEGETVLHAQNPDAFASFLETSPELGALFVVSAVVLFANNALVVTIGTAVVLGLALYIALAFVMRLRTIYELTDLRVIKTSGLFREDVEWMTWKKITNVSVRQSVFDRLFGTAQIHILTASEASSFREMNDVSDYNGFVDIITRKVEVSK